MVIRTRGKSARIKIALTVSVISHGRPSLWKRLPSRPMTAPFSAAFSDGPSALSFASLRAIILARTSRRFRFPDHERPEAGSPDPRFVRALSLAKSFEESFHDFRRGLEIQFAGSENFFSKLSQFYLAFFQRTSEPDTEAGSPPPSPHRKARESGYRGGRECA